MDVQNNLDTTLGILKRCLPSLPCSHSRSSGTHFLVTPSLIMVQEWQLRQSGSLQGWTHLAPAPSAQLLFRSIRDSVDAPLPLPSGVCTSRTACFGGWFLPCKGRECLWPAVGLGTSQVTFGGRHITCCVVCCRNDSGDHSDHYYQVGSAAGKGVFCYDSQATESVAASLQW